MKNFILQKINLNKQQSRVVNLDKVLGENLQKTYSSGYLKFRLLSTYTNYYVVLQRIIFEPVRMSLFIYSFFNLSH